MVRVRLDMPIGEKDEYTTLTWNGRVGLVLWTSARVAWTSRVPLRVIPQDEKDEKEEEEFLG
jgi:hypothetical protein